MEIGFASKPQPRPEGGLTGSEPVIMPNHTDLLIGMCSDYYTLIESHTDVEEVVVTKKLARWFYVPVKYVIRTTYMTMRYSVERVCRYKDGPKVREERSTRPDMTRRVVIARSEAPKSIFLRGLENSANSGVGFSGHVQIPVGAEPTSDDGVYVVEDAATAIAEEDDKPLSLGDVGGSQETNQVEPISQHSSALKPKFNLTLTSEMVSGFRQFLARSAGLGLSEQDSMWDVLPVVLSGAQLDSLLLQARNAGYLSTQAYEAASAAMTGYDKNVGFVLTLDSGRANATVTTY